MPSEFAAALRTPHQVFIADEQGVFQAFEQLKSTLGVGVYISFVYAHSDQTATLYQQELVFLANRFSTHLQIHKVTLNAQQPTLPQEFIEALVNSNTSEKLTFYLFGTERFMESISQVLHFLGIESMQKYTL